MPPTCGPPSGSLRSPTTCSSSELVDRARHHPGTVIGGNVLGSDLEAVVIRNEFDEVYLAIRVVGGGPRSAHAVILSLAVPGLDADDWTPVDPRELPEQLGDTGHGQIIWFTLLEVPGLGM